MVKSIWRVLLPVTQVALAIMLTTSFFLRARHESMASPAWLGPGRQFCDAVNAPAALIRFCVLHTAPNWFLTHRIADIVVETLLYFGLVGLVWYGVSLELCGSARNQGSVITSKFHARKSADLFLVCFGAGIGFVGERLRHDPVSFYHATYSNVVSAVYFAWALILITFYGHDLWLAVTSKAGKS